MARHFAKVVTSPVGIGTTTVVNKVTNVIVAYQISLILS